MKYSVWCVYIQYCICVYVRAAISYQNLKFDQKFNLPDLDSFFVPCLKKAVMRLHVGLIMSIKKGGGGFSFQLSAQLEWEVVDRQAHYNPQHQQHCSQTSDKECGQENEEGGVQQEILD